MKIAVVSFIFLYLSVLACVGAAEINFKRAVQAKDVKRLKTAQRLNPFVSDYFYREYRLSGDLNRLVHAMSLEPTKAAYHMYYGLALLKRVKRTKTSDEEAVTEICRAARLKPYSEPYRSACEKYKAVISIPDRKPYAP